MKIAVMAAGAVGGYFGARLADAGHDVFFLARGKHLKAIRSRGLQVRSELGDLHLNNIGATDDPTSIGPVEIIIFAVKLWDTVSSVRACRSMLAENTAVISFQNGIESNALISKELGAKHAMTGSAYISSVISEPGVIRHFGNFAKLVFGENDNQPSNRTGAFLEACLESGIEAVIPDDIHAAVWDKFVTLTTMSGATAATRSSIGTILADPDMTRMYRVAMSEIVAVGRASGVNFPDDIIERQMGFAANLPPDMTASTLKDLESGNRLETPWLTGAVVRLGRELNIATPVNETLNSVLKPYENGG
ncbi:MAG: ketopantoate reductase family protein [Rhodospirillales bacterium]|jgi:2-dehydropantoate 2-reductase|nr:ketopantoate reductase family protein [Rhodospirillales bacterium]MDP6843226.1 ketopantoate reductase family protein [Rhodospirillales bacterium]